MNTGNSAIFSSCGTRIFRSIRWKGFRRRCLCCLKAAAGCLNRRLKAKRRQLKDLAVKDGVVSLGGELGSTSEKDQLVHRAHVTGVTEVWADDVMINSDLAMEGLRGKIAKPASTLKALDDAYAADPRLKGADVSATVAGSQMTLTGTAPTPEARLAAESTARGLPGILIVANEIRVTGTDGTSAAVGKDQRVAAVGE